MCTKFPTKCRCNQTTAVVSLAQNLYQSPNSVQSTRDVNRQKWLRAKPHWWQFSIKRQNGLFTSCNLHFVVKFKSGAIKTCIATQKENYTNGF